VKVNKKVRQQVYEMFDGKCAYCGCDMELKGMHVDHVAPIRRNKRWDTGKLKWIEAGCGNPDGHTIDNMLPACASCNINKHSMTLEEFRAAIEQFVKSLNLYSTQYKIAKRYGLIQETNIKVLFYYEQINTTASH
jgi:5-methylcytosine-specific restriction endonuclease McrA